MHQKPIAYKRINWNSPPVEPATFEYCEESLCLKNGISLKLERHSFMQVLVLTQQAILRNTMQNEWRQFSDIPFFKETDSSQYPKVASSTGGEFQLMRLYAIGCRCLVAHQPL